MRELKECKAEVFRRSENRIRERRKSLNRVLALTIPLCLILTVISALVLPEMTSGGDSAFLNGGYQDGNGMYESIGTQQNGTGEYSTGANHMNGKGEHTGMEGDGAVTTGAPEHFSFSFTWNTYGISSYDSATGKLVKTTDATHPEDYVTVLHLDDTQLSKIWDLFQDLDIETYPDEYDPHGGGIGSCPSMTLILTLRDGNRVKTVRAEDIVLSYQSDDPKGQEFLDVCKGIRDILTATEEWKALPEYEFFYD